MSAVHQHYLPGCAGFLEDNSSFEGEGKAESQRTWRGWSYINCNPAFCWLDIILMVFFVLCLSILLFRPTLVFLSVFALVSIESAGLNSRNDFIEVAWAWVWMKLLWYLVNTLHSIYVHQVLMLYTFVFLSRIYTQCSNL